MKKIVILAAMLAAGVAVHAQQSPVEGGVNSSYGYENSIQVTGRSEREVTPDEIYVRIVIDEKEMKLKKTVEQAERDMIRSLGKLGIDTEKNLRIDRMSSGYKDYFLRTGQARTTATYELKVDGASQLGMVYQALEADGISNMTIARRTHSKIKEIQREMRVEAMNNAREMAEDLVGALGQRLGPAVYIVDYGNDSAVSRNSVAGLGIYASRAVRAEDSYETPLEFSDLQLSYSVQVKFALDGVK